MPTRSADAPRVTIISPVYNAERYLGACIDSVLGQTFAEWEQIVVDDGSTDDTEAVARSYDDPRIRYIRLPHRGLPALAESYNTALREARGELIAVLEGDDVWEPTKLARQVPLFDDPAVVLSWTRARIIDGAGQVSRRWQVPRRFRRDLGMSELFRVLARWNILSPALTVMIRRGPLEAIGGFQQMGSSLFVDLPTWLMIAGTASGKARYLDEDLGLYRIHATNTGSVKNAQMRLEHQDVTAAVKSRLGAARLAALGWTERDERVTRASAAVTNGIAYLQQSNADRARAAFRTAMKETRSAREYTIALTGYLSALSGVNLIGRAQRLRLSAASLYLRIRP